MDIPGTAIPPANRWAVLGIIMLGTFMAILDSAIVNVALPHMMSAFGVTRDQIEWVSTSFMLASAVTMPLIGWITKRVSYKTLYLGSLLLFTAASALCAFAWSFESLVFARIIQAIGSGAMQPVGMAIVADLFEPRERGKALGVWGTGMMVGPAVGPTLGGYLTDSLGWRSIFSVNLPFGVITLLAGLMIMQRNTLPVNKPKLDLWGYGFLTMGLISALLGLSNGQDEGWGSMYVMTCAALTVVGLTMFVAIESVREHPLLDLKLFLVRNYTISIILAVFRAIGLFGSIFLLPIFLQRMVGYTTIQTGLWLLPGAVMVGMFMPIAGRLADRYSPSILSAIGCCLVGVSLLLFGNLDPMSSWHLLIGSQMMRGMGLAMLMAPLMTAALNSVPQHEIPMASAFLNVSQSVGGALGIALLNSFVTTQTHQHAVRMGEKLATQMPVWDRLTGYASAIVPHQIQGTLVTPALKSSLLALQTINQRAGVLGFDNAFTLAGIIVLLAVPICFLLEPLAHHKRGGSGPAGQGKPA